MSRFSLVIHEIGAHPLLDIDEMHVMHLQNYKCICSNNIKTLLIKNSISPFAIMRNSIDVNKWGRIDVVAYSVSIFTSEEKV